ncbi:MAG: DUF4234 domain-containing protein [Ilumatobacteraceae bacterium]
MSDFQPPTQQPPPATPPAYSPPGAPPGGPGGGYLPVPTGRVPEQVGGAYYSPGLVILLSIVTIGIWTILWSYRTNEDLKRYNGDGLGGTLAVVIHILLSVVLMFTIPNEIQKIYERDGRESPVSTVWGLWFLLPIIGNIIWYLKVQRALNDFWLSKGAQPV